MFILVICDTSQLGMVPYPLELPYVVHSPSTGLSAKQLSIASMNVKSVIGVNACAKKETTPFPPLSSMLLLLLAPNRKKYNNDK
jgi:hypothetical protein